MPQELLKSPGEILQQYWGYSQFRPLQEDIISAVLEGKDTVALLPTGGGKSICYQVPALSQEGITVVISPLIALMKDQVQNLKQRGIKARAIFSGMSKREIDITLDNCVYGNIKLLYVSPERLSTTLFIERVRKMKVNLLAVDEAHCISQWGYDFRPQYLKIADIKEYIPNVPILALTATATPQVEKDIIEKLQLRQPDIFRQSFKRENISLSIFSEEDKQRKLLEIMSNVRGTGIIYTRNRRKTKDVASFLIREGISADFYHAGLDAEQRSRKQDLWLQGSTRIMVCTNAFGMGIDKADVRTVVHVDIPESLEAYYQEAGRAGRDGKKSYAVVLYQKQDLAVLRENWEAKFPPMDSVKRVYNAIGNHFQLAVGAGEFQSFELDINAFCKTFNIEPTEAYHSLRLLEEEEYIVVSDAIYMPSRLLVTADKESLYRIQVENRKLEPLIKLILRSYEGVFDHFVKIDEKSLAKHLGIAVKDVRLQIEHLQKLGLMEYIPVKEQPQVTFLKPRLSPDNLKFNHGHIKARKAATLKQLEAVERYIRNNSHCRSRVMLEYFGEKNAARCSICDICLERNKLELSDDLFNKMKDHILNELKEPKSIRMLTSAVKGMKKDQMVMVVRWLLDEGKIYENEQNELTLRP